MFWSSRYEGYCAKSESIKFDHQFYIISTQSHKTSFIKNRRTRKNTGKKKIFWFWQGSEISLLIFQFYMNGHHIRYISYEGDRQVIPTAGKSQKNRETFIRTPKDQRGILSRDGKPYTSPSKFGKGETSIEKEVPANRPSPFQRSRPTSNDKTQKSRGGYRSGSKGMQDNRREVLKFSQIKKKLEDEIIERQRLQQLSVCQELKLSNLGEQINRLRLQKKQLDTNILQLEKSNEEGKNLLSKANQTIENLNKNIKEIRINQKSLNTLKNMQNQIDFLQERNKKLISENQELAKINNNLKLEIKKMTRQSTSESENSSKITKTETTSCTSLDKRLPSNFRKNKSERQKFLEMNLHELEKRLYEKDKEIKKMQIQLNCIDRKKILSIDEVRHKKDRQIKDLRQKFMKVTKDLKQTKQKFDKNQKREQRNLKDVAFLRKVKSSKHLGITSESEEITLELSSQP